MLLPRIIPVLLLKNRGLVKGVRFKDHRYVGDPINAVQIFNTKKVDELFILDITATEENRIPDLELVQSISDQCLMPFALGGGIKTLDDAKRVLNSGAEKVSLNTYALESKTLIEEIAKVFGSQSVVVSLDIKKNIFGNYCVYSRCGTSLISKDLNLILRQIEDQGAGEVLINNIDTDGMCDGYDLNLLSKVTNLTKIPVIASGGAWLVDHLKVALEQTKISAVAAGSMFVFHGRRKAVLISYPSDSELISIRGE
ncbi:MAG: AglZ/HisF2 family acetamidino modification protein [Leptospira sp.]|nr:AglZ/HisF2 family acetamidino modification protein [Leptospira sp.]